MPIHTRTGVYLLACVPVVAAAQDSSRPASKSSLEAATARYDAAVGKARAEYDRLAASAAKDLAAELDAASLEAGRAGDRAAVQAFWSLKTALNAGPPDPNPQGAVCAARTAVAAAAARKAFAGRWSIEYQGYKAVWTCLPDGTVVSSDGGGKGRWFLELDRGQVSLTFGDHDLQVFPLPLQPQGMPYGPYQAKGQLTGRAVKLP